MNIDINDEQAHSIELTAHMLLGLLQIAAEPDDAEPPMSLEGAQVWARTQLSINFPIQTLNTPIEPHNGWHLEYQLCGSLPYYDPSLRSQYELRPVIAHLSEGTEGPELGAEVWCVYWVDEIGLNDWIEWFDTHIEAANYLGRLVVAAFTGEHIDTIRIERKP